MIEAILKILGTVADRIPKRSEGRKRRAFEVVQKIYAYFKK